MNMNIVKRLRQELQPHIELWWPDGKGETKKIELDHTINIEDGEDKIEIDITEPDENEKPN